MGKDEENLGTRSLPPPLLSHTAERQRERDLSVCLFHFRDTTDVIKRKIAFSYNLKCPLVFVLSHLTRAFIYRETNEIKAKGLWKDNCMSVCRE